MYHVMHVRLTVYHVIRGKSRDACQANCVVKTVGGADGADSAETAEADGWRVGGVTCSSAKMLFAGFASSEYCSKFCNVSKTMYIFESSN